MKHGVTVQELGQTYLPYLPRMAYAAGYAYDDKAPSYEEAMAEGAVDAMFENFGVAGDLGLVAVRGGEPCGMAWTRSFQTLGHPWRSTVPELPELFVATDEHSRNNGVGSLLLGCLMMALRNRGKNLAALHTFADNEPALRLYDKFGFSIAHEATSKEGKLYYMMVASLRDGGIL